MSTFHFVTTLCLRLAVYMQNEDVSTKEYIQDEVQRAVWCDANGVHPLKDSYLIL